MNPRSFLFDCSIFDTVQLFGEGSPLDKEKYVLLHVQGQTAFLQHLKTKKVITLDNDTFPNIVGCKKFVEIVQTDILTTETVVEKEERNITYLDDTVFSELFDHFVDKKAKDPTVEAQNVFEMIKTFQDRENSSETIFMDTNNNIDEGENSKEEKEEKDVMWKSGLRKDALSPLLDRVSSDYQKSSPFLFPIIEMNKDKFRTKEEQERFRKRMKEKYKIDGHVCDSIPLKANRVSLIRKFSNGEEDKFEVVSFEKMPSTLVNSPWEWEFKYKNLYRSNSRTVCSSGGNNDRLYYTSLSSSTPSQDDTRSKTIIDEDFTRVLYYPVATRFESSPSDPYPNILSYRVRNVSVFDTRFDTRFIHPFLDQNINRAFWNYPLKPTHASLYDIVQKNTEKQVYLTDYLRVKNSNNVKWSDVNDTYDFFSIDSILQRHTDIKQFTSDVQFENLISSYSIVPFAENKLVTLQKIRRLIHSNQKSIQSGSGQEQKSCEQILKSAHMYVRIFNDLLQSIQGIEDVNDYNKIISTHHVIIQKLEKQFKKYKINNKHISFFRFVTAQNYDLKSTQLHAWLYNYFKQFLNSSAFDRLYSTKDSGQKHSTINNLLKAAIGSYGFKATSLSPLNKFECICHNDISKMKIFNHLVSAHDTGKLIFELLNSKATFSYIDALKEKVLRFGEKRYTFLKKKKKWDELSENEQLRFSPSRNYLEEIRSVIIGPILSAFRSIPKMLCSNQNIVKVYPSLEALENENNISNIHSDKTLILTQKLLGHIKTALQNEPTSSEINDDIFETVLNQITAPTTSLPRFVREGEYATILHTNILYQRINKVWTRQTMDVNSIITETQCPFNFEEIETLDWAILSKHANMISDKELDSLCVFESTLQECLPYPLFTLFQFLRKMFARYIEISRILENIEVRYEDVLGVVQTATNERILRDQKKYRTPFHSTKQSMITSSRKKGKYYQLSLILKDLSTNDVFSESMKRASEQFLQFVSLESDSLVETIDYEEQRKFVYWKSSDNKTCRHWLDLATIMTNDPGSEGIRQKAMHQFSTRWPTDSTGHCMNCGVSIVNLIQTNIGTAWEQVSENKEAVQTRENATLENNNTIPVLVDDLHESSELNDKLLRGLTWYAKTLGLRIPLRTKESLVVFLTNIVIPQMKFRSEDETRREIFENTVKLEKWYKKSETERLKLAKRAHADPNFFNNNTTDYVKFLKRLLTSNKIRDQTKIKKYTKYIQTLDLLQRSHVAYEQEQYVLAIVATLYLHVLVSVPNYVIEKRDTISSSSHLPLDIFAELNSEKKGFLRTMCIFLLRMITTPSENAWPNTSTRESMKRKVRQVVQNSNMKLSLEDATIKTYYDQVNQYVTVIQRLYPQFDSLVQQKEIYVSSLQKKNCTKNLTMFRPSIQLSLSSPAQSFMNDVNEALKNRVKQEETYFALTNVAPYEIKQSSTHPFVESLIKSHPFLSSSRTEKTPYNTAFKRITFQTNTEGNVLPDGTNKNLDGHEEQNQLFTLFEPGFSVDSKQRYQKFINTFSLSGHRKIFKPIDVSYALLDDENYIELIENDATLTNYHPAIQESLEIGNGQLERLITYYEEPTFKSGSTFPYRNDDFERRLFSYRKQRQIIPPPFPQANQANQANELDPKTEDNFFLDQISVLVNRFQWVDDVFFSEVIREISSDPKFLNHSFEDFKAKSEVFIKSLLQTHGYYEEIITVCMNYGMQVDKEDEKSQIDANDMRKAIFDLIKCIKAVLHKIQNACRGTVWKDSFTNYFPINSDTRAKEVKISETLQIYGESTRFLHVTSDRIITPLKNYHAKINSSVMFGFENLSSDSRDALTTSLHTIFPKPSDIQPDLSNLNDNEMKRYHVCIAYVLVKILSKIHDLPISEGFRKNVFSLCINFIRDLDEIQRVSESAMTKAQMYIDQKNNLSRVRFMERLKAQDPFLENSHHIFRDFNLGGIDHGHDFDLIQEENQGEEENKENNEDNEDNEEEGYSTMETNNDNENGDE